MRILFLLTYYTPYISGLTLYVKRLAEALAKKSYQVEILSFQYDKKLSEKEILNRVKVIRAKPLLKISKGFLSFDWIVKSWQEIKKSEVVLTSLPQFEAIIPAAFAKLLGKKVISIYHCEVVLPFTFFNYLVERILHLSSILTLSLSDEIVTYTEDFARNSKILARFDSKLKSIYPPVRQPKVDKRIQKLIKKKIGKEPNFTIGLAARLAAEKGIEYVLESIPILNSKFKIQNSKFKFKIKNRRQKTLKTPPRWPSLARTPRTVEGSVKIVIAGPMDPVGEKSYKEKILKLVEKYKNYVVFLGELKEEEMGSFYSLLDVLVLPSINSTEAFGMVQVEAMMMGLPVVATNLPGVRVPIQKTGMGLLVPIKNSQKLAEAIVHLLLNKDKYIKDKKLVEKEFSFEKTIKFYERKIILSQH